MYRRACDSSASFVILPLPLFIIWLLLALLDDRTSLSCKCIHESLNNVLTRDERKDPPQEVLRFSLPTEGTAVPH